MEPNRPPRYEKVVLNLRGTDQTTTLLFACPGPMNLGQEFLLGITCRITARDSSTIDSLRLSTTPAEIAKNSFNYEPTTIWLEHSTWVWCEANS
eukprot:2351116-Rhodomonas_salina.1